MQIFPTFIADFLKNDCIILWSFSCIQYIMVAFLTVTKTMKLLINYKVIKTLSNSLELIKLYLQ